MFTWKGTYRVCFIFFLFLSVQANGQMDNAFNIHGKVDCNKADLDSIRIILINGKNGDTSNVELDNGRYDFLMGFNRPYMLLAYKGDKLLKKVFINSDVPSNKDNYRMKLILKLEQVNRLHAYVRYSRGNKRFMLRDLRINEIKRKRENFEPFADELMEELTKKKANP